MIGGAHHLNAITLKLYDSRGALLNTRTISLPPNGHLAQFATELFPELNGMGDFDGALSISSAIPFEATALRTRGAGKRRGRGSVKVRRTDKARLVHLKTLEQQSDVPLHRR